VGVVEDDAAVPGWLQLFQNPTVTECLPDHRVADLKSEGWSRVGQGEDVDSPVRAAGAVQAVYVSGAVRTVEDVEQCA
jgi:hypothetical protein